MVLGGQRVAGHRFLQLRDGHDVAGPRLGDVDVLLALREEEARKALRRCPASSSSRCRRTGKWPDRTRRYEIRPAKGSDTVLKTWATAGSFSFVNPCGFAVLARPLDRSRPRGREESRRRRQGSAERRCRAARTRRAREDLPRRDLLLQPREDVGGVERSLGEELLHQPVLAFRDHLDELLVLGLRPLGELLRDRTVDALAPFVQVGLHPDEVHRPAKSLLLPDGDLERDDAAAESLLAQRLHDAVERGPLPVHPVHDEEDRAA